MSPTDVRPSLAPAAVNRRPVQVWIGGLLLALVLLVGRYDWAGSHDSSLLGYVCSAFFLVILLPVVHYTLLRLLPESRPVLAVTILIGAWFSLPYRWLGLERFSINHSFPISVSTQPLPMLAYDWFPGALRNLPSIPHEGALFAGLALMGLLVAWWLRSRAAGRIRFVLPGLLLYFLVLLQTWLHLSLRAPMTYAGSLVGGNAWPVLYLFPGSDGAVNGDYPIHRAMESLFLGLPTHLLLAKRSFYYYLTSQFSYFVNPYYVGLTLNIGFWFAAVLCGYSFVRRIWDARTGLFAAFLIATGPGFIYYVAQPMSYLAGYALCIILIYLFWRLVIDSGGSYWSSILFGAILGLSSLVYEGLAPLFIFLVAYSLVKGVKWQRLGIILGLLSAVYLGYHALLLYGLRQSLDPFPYVSPNIHAATRLSLILNGSLDHIYLLVTQVAVLFWGGLGNAFFILPLWLAVLGLAFVRGSNRIVIVFLLLALPMVWTAVFHFGGVATSDNSYAYSTWPRYLYIGYPAIYALAALFLRRLTAVRWVHPGGGELPVGALGAAAVLAGVLVLSNHDAWGFQAAYHLFGFLSPTLKIIP